MNVIVTVKLPKNIMHDWKKKVTGSCLVSRYCTDVTGEHHSFLVTDCHDSNEAILKTKLKYGPDIHITRLEVI